MATFLERAAHLVNRTCYLCSLFAFFADLGFEGGNLVLIAPVLGHCLPFTLFTTGDLS